MEKEKLRKTTLENFDNLQESQKKLIDQPAEEFIQDKADWSEDISNYKKSKKHK